MDWKSAHGLLCTVHSSFLIERKRRSLFYTPCKIKTLHNALASERAALSVGGREGDAGRQRAATPPTNFIKTIQVLIVPDTHTTNLLQRREFADFVLENAKWIKCDTVPCLSSSAHISPKCAELLDLSLSVDARRGDDPFPADFGDNTLCL